MPGTVEPVLGRADAIVVAGSSAPWHPPQAALRPGCAVIHLEEDPLRPRAPYWGYQTTHAVAGDREANLRGLAERVRRRLHPPQDRAARWTDYKRRGEAQARKDADAAQAQVQGAVPPASLFRALHRGLPESTSIVDEIVSEITALRQFLFESRPFRQYRGWHGALGTGLGTALGVKLARPGDTVVCVIGDGAFHYNPVPAALGFAQQYGTPLLIVVCDNHGYQSQTWNVHKYFADGAAVRSGQFFGDVLAPSPDYVKLVEAYGGTGERVENVAALEPAIERALAALAEGRSALLDVCLTGVPDGKWQG
jgi:acetolactate synthase-1/2/3 large subunit